MSYGMSAALQQAVFVTLSGDAAVSALVGAAIYDAVPPGPVPDLYLSLGPERARDMSDVTGDGAVHEFPITVVENGAGFLGAKDAAAAVSDALTGAALTLGRGRLVSLRFRRARARRVANGREIELWFRAHVDEGLN